MIIELYQRKNIIQQQLSHVPFQRETAQELSIPRASGVMRACTIIMNLSKYTLYRKYLLAFYSHHMFTLCRPHFMFLNMIQHTGQ